MAHREDERASPNARLVSAVLALIEPALTEGLDPEDARWAVELYRDRLLPTRLAGTTEADEALTERRVQSVVDSLNARMASLSPADKRQLLRVQDWTDRLGALNAEALNLALARARYPGEAPRNERAIALRDELQAFGRTLRKDAPDVAPFVEAELSEATLDADYAVSPGDVTSLRLHRLLRPIDPRAERELDSALEGERNGHR